MRQLFTVRFWMTLVALLALTGLARTFARSHQALPVVAAATSPAEHTIDLLTVFYSAEQSADFQIRNGVTTGELRLYIDGSRTMSIEPGTPGQIACPPLDEIGRCVVAADLLGDAVLWFSIVPSEPRPSVTLPGIVELRDQNAVLLANGWVVKRSSEVATNCADDVMSLSDFVHHFGKNATSTFNFERQQVVKVTCNAAPKASTTVPTTIVGDDATTTVAPDAGVPDASNSGIG